jgi:hypothetical protein
MTSTGSSAWNSAPTINVTKPFNPRELLAYVLRPDGAAGPAALWRPVNSPSAPARRR